MATDASPAPSIRTILVPTDFSDGAACALRWARALAAPVHAQIALLHVVDLSYIWTPLSGPASLPVPISADVAEQIQHTAQTALDALAADAPEVTQRLVRRGHPREVIVAVAREEEMDVIVMGTQGRHGFSRLLIGSVAEYVVRHAAVPVLTIRGG